MKKSRLKSLLLNTRKGYLILKPYWLYLLFFGMLFSAIALSLNYKNKLTYVAHLSFFAEENEGAITGYSGIKAFKKASKKKLGLINHQFPEKLNAIGRSRSFLTSILFERVSINSLEDYFANHIIRIQKLHRSWKKKSYLDNYQLDSFYFIQSNHFQFSDLENVAFSQVYARLIGNNDEGYKPMLKYNFNKDAQVFEISVKSKDEGLSKVLVETIFDHLNIYYLNQLREPQIRTTTLLKSKIDSIENNINKLDLLIANAYDRNKGVVKVTQKVKRSLWEKEKKNNLILYSSLFKQNQEIQNQLDNIAPILKLIDNPILPIQPEQKSYMLILVTSFLFGVILASIYFLMKAALI